ncbi:hypothetical protein ES319_D06G104600v1 [Gossypium barbadense]|uniref:Oleosin n=7 Tax=Gossypium TaxID=3633 RepID=A0A5J5R1R6_GOSBA|nr:hypothetical protein ES319_D06G104600v1 [Gossypium barbadense]TYG64479.1 hypothetical protein ES288_D06G111600v1 [Gossypium darwinii]
MSPPPSATYPPFLTSLYHPFPPYLSHLLHSSFLFSHFFFFSLTIIIIMPINDQNRPMAQKLYDSAPSSRQVAKFLTASTLGATLLFLSGLTLTGTVIALIIATPLMVIFSPVLVPAGITIFLVTTGFLFSGGCGVAALTALSWIYNYVQGKHPPGADQLDYARNKLASTARDMTEKAKEYGQYVQHKAQEVTQGQAS